VPRRRKKLTYLEAAADDIRRLHAENSPLAFVVFQRLTDLANGTLQGQPLQRRASGDLSDCHKIYVGLVGGRPTHRIVYRQLRDGMFEVIEVFAVGPREAALVYLEAIRRLGRQP
jgi:hypothetical protein